MGYLIGNCFNYMTRIVILIYNTHTYKLKPSTYKYKINIIICYYYNTILRCNLLTLCSIKTETKKEGYFIELHGCKLPD